jgi:hypothetical protein
MSTILADYEPERGAFNTLLQENCRERILLFRGPHGRGKSRLLRYCKEQMPPNTPYVWIQFNTAVSIYEILFKFCRRLGLDLFPRFTEQIDQLADSTPRVNIDGNWQFGIGNKIQVVLNVKNTSDREYRRTTLTYALFDDIMAFEQSVLFLFDAYEEATTEVKDWISGPLLERVAEVEQVRVVITGQRLPDEHDAEWGHCCKAYDLLGVFEARHWVPIVQKMARRIIAREMNGYIDVPDSYSWLACLCEQLNGNPAEIMKIIEALPPMEQQS